LPWGKNQPAKSVSVFTASWIAMFVIASLIAASGVRPLQFVNVSVIFGMVIMPLTYFPILRVAADKEIMGKHVNSKMDTVLGTTFLILITGAAVVAIPLMIVTHSGRP
jgi:manganese transport protein